MRHIMYIKHQHAVQWSSWLACTSDPLRSCPMRVAACRLQESPGVFNEVTFRALDWLLDEARHQLPCRLGCRLTNNDRPVACFLAGFSAVEPAFDAARTAIVAVLPAPCRVCRPLSRHRNQTAQKRIQTHPDPGVATSRRGGAGSGSS